MAERESLIFNDCDEMGIVAKIAIFANENPLDHRHD